MILRPKKFKNVDGEGGYSLHRWPKLDLVLTWHTDKGLCYGTWCIEFGMLVLIALTLAAIVLLGSIVYLSHGTAS